MSTGALAVIAGSCVAGACLAATAAMSSTVAWTPSPRRIVTTANANRSTQRGGFDTVGTAGEPRSRPGAVALRLGTALRRRLGAPDDDAAAAMTGSMLLVAGPLAVVDLRLGLVALLAIRIRPILVRRRRRIALEYRVVNELPEVIDLVRLGLASGGSALVALRSVSARPTGPVTAALGAVVARVDAGHRLTDALEDLPATLGEPVRSLVRALVSAERYGVELGPTLDRLAGETRADRRRRAQTRARRVPVQMLLPLVVCILPAFVVLTLVPTLVSTFETLEL